MTTGAGRLSRTKCRTGMTSLTANVDVCAIKRKTGAKVIEVLLIAERGAGHEKPNENY